MDQIADHAHCKQPAWHERAAAVLEHFFLTYRNQLRWVHLAMFVVFMAILFVPLALPEPPEHATPLTLSPPWPITCCGACGSR